MNVSFLNTHPHIGVGQHQYLFDNVMLRILTNLVIKHSQKDENQLLLMKLIRRDTRKPSRDSIREAVSTLPLSESYHLGPFYKICFQIVVDCLFM